MLESIRPELQQYFIERDYDGRPFDRDVRSLVYQRAKGDEAELPFGTERNVYAEGYEYFESSIRPLAVGAKEPRVRIGGPDCTKPYDMSLLNVSAMSFGSLSANAILALNQGAALGGFAHDTGEGGLSDYHLRHGGDLVWEIGTAYFGCRTADGGFDRARFAEKAAHDNVKCVSLKLSQGAKPGIGGVLPGEKVTAEIARVREVPEGKTVISPPYHQVFSTPRELIRFIAEMRELSGGKPVGFKLCVGSRREFLAVCKALIEEGTAPDFIIVDGAEGGTGAAPLEFADHLGSPLTEGLITVHNALVGVGLRDRIKIGASGKVATGADIVKRIVQGADFTNSARAMMFAIGCIQAQSCHTNACPVGVATQDPRRARLARRRQVGPGPPLPVRHGEKRTADHRLAGRERTRRTAPAHAAPACGPGHRPVLRGTLRLAGSRAVADRSARVLGSALEGRRSRPLQRMTRLAAVRGRGRPRDQHCDVPVRPSVRVRVRVRESLERQCPGAAGRSCVSLTDGLNGEGFSRLLRVTLASNPGRSRPGGIASLASNKASPAGERSAMRTVCHSWPRAGHTRTA